MLATGEAEARIFYLDHLRTALVMLVVLHHLALVYGALAPFYYQEPPFTDPLAFVVLALFALINQAWFMGALFFLAGYFTPLSFDRKGVRAFVSGRLLRLGVPILAGLFLLEPLARIGFYLMPAQLTGIASPFSVAAYPKMIGLGPLWFIFLLLVFSLGYAGWRLLRGAAAAKHPKPPSLLAICGFAVGLALAHFVWRMLVPLGQDVTLGTDALSFPTIAYLPEYLSFFVLGTMAFRGNWLDRLSGWHGWAGGGAALVATVILLPWAISGQPFVPAFAEGGAFAGRGTFQSGLYAVWDALLAVGLMLAALTLFRALFGGVSALGRFLSEQSYAVYLIHSMVIVFIAFALRGLSLPALGKFVLAAAIVLPAAYGIAWIIRRPTWVRRVI